MLKTLLSVKTQTANCLSCSSLQWHPRRLSYYCLSNSCRLWRRVVTHGCIKTHRSSVSSLFFQTFWPKWLKFFRSFQNHFGPRPKKTPRSEIFFKFGVDSCSDSGYNHRLNRNL